MNKYIIFCVEHYNPLGIVRSLGEKGINPIVIVIKNKIVLTSKSKYISELYVVDSIENGYKRLCKILELESEKPFVYTADDKITCYLDLHYDELKNKCYFFNAGEKSRISYFINKKNILECAKRHGLKVLDTIVVKKGEIPDNLDYPIITKAEDPTVGAWKNDMFICNNREELRGAFEKIESPSVILQKYIKKKNEYCLEGFSINNGQQMIITIASTYNYLLDISYSPYMTVKNFDRYDIKEKLDEMYKEIGFEGIFEIEFLVSDDDELYFGEINFRNSTWSYASTCAGMNLPWLWSEAMKAGMIDTDVIKNIKSGFTAMVEVTDFKDRVIKQKYNIFKWIRDLRKADCKYYIGKNDFRPVISNIKSRIFGRG